MRLTRMLLAAAGAAAVAGVLASGSAWTVPAKASTATGAPHVQVLAVTIRSSGRDDAERVSPENLAIAPGVLARITFTNFTRQFHTFTVPGLHVSALIFPARGQTPRKTTFTFTAYEGGSFAWYCVFCAQGRPGHDGPMGGRVYVIINPSVLP